MRPNPKDLYLARVEYGESHDTRPCVIVELLDASLAKIAFVSSSVDLYQPIFDFLIPRDHADFASTGLKRTSFVSGRSFVAMPLTELGRHIGCITGELAKDFDDWLG